MNNNLKNFNKYVFLTTLARCLLEVFVGTILFKAGFTLREVIFYYLLVNLFSVILCVPCNMISKKYSNKILVIIGFIVFLTLQFILNHIVKSFYFLFIPSFLYALYRRCYWISRRYLTLYVVDNQNNTSKQYSIISILNQLGVITASYVGSLILEFSNIMVITIISVILLIISTIDLFKIKIEKPKNEKKLNLFKTYKHMPFSTVMNICAYEVQNVYKFLFPLYLIIYVKDTYTTIGIVYFVVNIATIIFTYLYGRLINKNKNYLKLSILLFALVKLAQVNTFGILLMIASFLDGFTTKMYELSIHKPMLKLSSYFEYNNFNFMYEFTENMFRLITVVILYITNFDLKIMIYITILFTTMGILFKYKDAPIDKDDNDDVLWHEEIEGK